MSSRGLSVACLPAILLACLPVPASGARPTLERPVAGELQRASDRYAKLPMAFEPNLGQSDERVRYLARGHGYAVFVTGDEVVLALPGRPAEHRGDSLLESQGEALR